MISNLTAFVAETLVKYFRHSRYASFQRQLNLYGFRKNERGAFEHEFFQRGNPEMLGRVLRTPQATKGTKRTLVGSTALSCSMPRASTLRSSSRRSAEPASESARAHLRRSPKTDIIQA